MKRNSIHRMLSVLLCVVLIAALALFAAGCTDSETNTDLKTFTFVMVDAEGNEKSWEIESDAATVGEALLAEEIIAGEDGDYGLYVKTVDGITLDYETDGKYWAFYIGEEYGLTGVDQTPITDGETYSFKAE